MATKPETTSIPPDTGEIDTEWSDTASVVDTSAEGDALETAVPPEPYERYARGITSGKAADPAMRKALSAPGLPALDASILDELMEKCSQDSGEMEATVPLLGHQPSGPYAIPLELEDDGQLRPSERPTTPQLEPPVEFASAVPTPKIEARQTGEWTEEPLTPLVTSSELRGALRSTGPVIRTGIPVEDTEVSITMGEPEYLALDDPGGISMEDSLEISLDFVPPAPFDAPALPLVGLGSSPVPRREPSEDSLELSLDGAGDALDLVAARATPPPDPSDPLVDLRDRYAVGDFTGAHEIAEAILAEQPDNPEALRFRESCRDVLMQMYCARIGPTSSIPKLAIPAAELQWLSLDHRSGFLLSCVDGQSTVEEILDVSGMPALDALRILYNLMQQRIIHMIGS
jgi:hypothetical protein